MRAIVIAFVQGLLEIGERAVEEYITAVENTEGEAGARRLKDWWHRRKSEGL
jgi:hypothetical protein